MSFEIPAVDEYNMGELIYQLEMSCCIMANLLGVDPFDQPGVELGKKLAYKILGQE
jgi:glucose-6-phosphate isomerase